MTSTELWLCVSLCFVCFHGAGGFPYCVVTECVFNSSELQDIQFIQSLVFNKQEFVRWDSRLDRYVGYTEYGMKQAERFNDDPVSVATMRSNRDGYCKYNVEVDYLCALEKTVEPYVRLSSAAPAHASRHTHMLVCSSYDFYPKHIIVTWLRDGEPAATSDVTTTDEEPDGDWYYQYHSYLEYTPRSGEQISCMVEHPGLTEPLFVHWGHILVPTTTN